MSNISNYNIITSSVLLQNAINYKSNPNLIQQNILNYLQGITNGQVDVVDPTNPFVFLLEASTVNSAAAIYEAEILSQRQYPSLARTVEDLYLHMNDTDYIDVFSAPANGTFTFLINKLDVINYSVAVPNEPYSQVTIPSNSYTTVDNYTFTLLYPIDILYYNNGTFLVQYDTSRPNELQAISSYIIEHTEITDPSGTEWLQFKVNINQFVISSEEYTLTSGEYFTESITYSNLFYYCRVFYLDTTIPNWVEMGTTYNAEVFNPNIPTALIQVLDGTIKVSIPQIYYDTGLIQSNIRIDVYTTLGEIDVNMAGYNVDQYTNVFTSINQYELNQYTQAMSNVGYLWYSNEIISGGNTAITFSQLQLNKVYNSLNGRLLPITNAQASSYFQYNGFTLVPNIDVITDRQFKAVAPPYASTNEFLVPSLNSSVLTFSITNTEALQSSKILTGNNVIIITPETLLINNEGSLQLVTDSQRNQINQLSTVNLVNEFNSTQYVYSPFYYAINTTTNELVVRAYWMGNPQMSNLNYISSNATTGHKVSTNSFAITKTSAGYTITLVNTGDSSYLALDPSTVFCQLAYIPYGQTAYAYMTAYAESTKASNGGFIFNFNFNTKFMFDINNNIDMDSFQMALYPNTPVSSPLNQTFNILYGINQTPVGYVANNAQINIFSNIYTGSNATVITHETIDIKFGTYLSNLWTKATMVNSTPTYLTYQNDVPLLYSEPVFQKNPVNGSIFNIVNNEIVYNTLHNVGDPVLDANGNPVIAHYAGELVLDANGNPIQIEGSSNQYIFDMVCYDGVYRIATDPNVTQYVQLATETMAQWATTSMQDIDNILFEQTTVLYSPTNSISNIECLVNNQSSSILLPAALTPIVNIYLSATDINNTNLQNQLQITVSNTIHQYLQNTTLSKTGLLNLLSTNIPNAITITVSGFFDSYDIVNIVNPQDLFMIDRINYLESTNIIGVEEDITINFLQAS